MWWVDACPLRLFLQSMACWSEACQLKCLVGFRNLFPGAPQLVSSRCLCCFPQTVPVRAHYSHCKPRLSALLAHICVNVLLLLRVLVLSTATLPSFCIKAFLLFLMQKCFMGGSFENLYGVRTWQSSSSWKSARWWYFAILCLPNG